MSKRAVIAES